MKPQKIVDDYDSRMLMGTESKIKRYLKEDCVIGIVDNCFGVMFIMKSKMKWFGFYQNKRSRYENNQLNDLGDYGMPQAIQDIEKEGKILDKKEWEKMCMKLTMQQI